MFKELIEDVVVENLLDRIEAETQQECRHPRLVVTGHGYACRDCGRTLELGDLIDEMAEN